MIAIIGGGISGLTLSHHLARAGIDHVVLEAGPRPGGVIASVRAEGRVLELGPQRTRLTRPLRRLVESLRLEDELVVAPPDLPLYVFARGRLRRVPLDLRTALTTDLIGLRDRGRILLEPFTRGLQPDESAAEYFTRKLGRRTYERIIAPLFGGLYASDPADMRARHALAAMLRTAGVGRSLLRALVRSGSRGRAPACSFRDGLQVLVDALAEEAGPRLRLRAAVRRIRGGPGAFRLLLDDDEIHADRVVLACPADAAGDTLASFDPDAAERLRALSYNPLALVHLLAGSGDRRAGLGYQVAFDEDLATRGVTWNHAMFDRPDLYTAFLGGALRPDVPALPDGALRELAVDEFRRVTGRGARAIRVHRTRMPAWDRSWDALDGLELPAGIEVCASWAARPGITGRLMEAERVAERLAKGGEGGVADGAAEDAAEGRVDRR